MRCALIGIWVLLGSVVAARGQDQTGDVGAENEPNTRTQRFLKLAEKAAGAYRLTPPDDPQSKFQLHQEALLRWTNPVGGDWDGAVYLWTYKGVPRAVASIYKGYHLPGQPVTHEFHSLSTGRFVAAREGRQVWHPESAGVVIKPIPDVLPPATNPNRRLLQMRSLARKFQAEKTERDGTDRKPRLLGQPLFRYRADKLDDELLDGALFAFVQGTDPEVWLLIEARSDDGAYRWHYGLARMNSVEFRVLYSGEQVWHVPRLAWSAVRDRDAPYTAFPRQ